MGCGSLATGLAFTLGVYLIFLHRQINYAEGAPSIDRATSNGIVGAGSNSESRRGSRSHAGNHLRFAQKLYGGRMRSAPAAVVLAADDFLPEEDDFDVVKKQFDDYGHMRFGKREEFDDYGHMRFGRSGGE